MKPIVSMLLAASLVTTAWAADEKVAAAVKPDLAKGQASYAAVCAACHGADGNSVTPTHPTLAQQHPDYLVKQLMEFKSGKRANAIMMPLASALSDADMRNIAAWLSTQKAKLGAAKDPKTIPLGERIWRGGIADRQIAACAGCHSPNGAGIPVQYPRLAGQHADYTVSQLQAFRDGVRNNSVQMTGVARKMRDDEMKAVSDYIAGLH